MGRRTIGTERVKMASVQLNSLTKRFGHVTVVDDVALDIADREFVVFVGPSGCGKTTTLRMIAGLEQISGGEVFIDGRRVNDISPARRNIAMVFQNFALYPHMTTSQNMSFALEGRKLSKDTIKRKVAEVAEMLELDDLLERRPADLSCGKQRLAWYWHVSDLSNAVYDAPQRIEAPRYSLRTATGLRYGPGYGSRQHRVGHPVL